MSEKTGKSLEDRVEEVVRWGPTARTEKEKRSGVLQKPKGNEGLGFGSK